MAIRINFLNRFKRSQKTEATPPPPDIDEFTFGTSNEKRRSAWIKKVLGQIPKGSRILDAGAGEHQYKKYCRHLRYVSQDFAQYDPSSLKAGLQQPKWEYGKLDIISDISAIPKPDQSFDVILCTEVLEHIPDPFRTLKEFSRLLRKGGQLIMTVPFASGTHFAPYHYFTGLNRYFYELYLPKYGFKIVELKRNGNFFEYVGQELHRLDFMTEKYKAGSLTPSEQTAVVAVLQALQRLSRRSRDTGEFLSFGYFIRAIKQ